jgi:hypothetical protein
MSNKSENKQTNKQNAVNLILIKETHFCIGESRIAAQNQIKISSDKDIHVRKGCQHRARKIADEHPRRASKCFFLAFAFFHPLAIDLIWKSQVVLAPNQTWCQLIVALFKSLKIAIPKIKMH